MRISIQDKDALSEVSPLALAAYACAAGWKKQEPFGDNSYVYVHENAPEIVIPRTQNLGDYVDVVSRLIEIFAETANTDVLSLYRDLVTADRDIVRVRAAPEGTSSSVPLDDGMNLIKGAHDMVLAAACSLSKPRPFYDKSANRDAVKFLQTVHLGQTEQGSYVVTLLAPVASLPIRQAAMHDYDVDDPLVERPVTKRLIEALTAARQATERSSDGDSDAFSKAAERGASANLCEAVATLIKPFDGIDISLTWALTFPMRTVRDTVRFEASDEPILSEAVRHLKKRQPRRVPKRKPEPRMSLLGRIQRLSRDSLEANGTVTLRTRVEGHMVSVAAALDRHSYDLAIRAHKDDATVIMTGDLGQSDGEWRLRNAHVENFISDEDGYLQDQS